MTRAKEPRLFAPVLDTFVRALPHTYRGVDAATRTHVRLVIKGDSGGAWSLVRGNRPNIQGTEARRTTGVRANTDDVAQPPPAVSPWNLYADTDTPPAATVTVDQETAWRLFTRGIDPATAREYARIEGDAELGEVALGAVAIIA